MNGGRLAQSFRTPKDVRLAYLGGSQQRNLPPVFVNDRGVVGIDPATVRRAGVGFTLQPIAAMGMSLEPDFAQVGDLTLAVSGGSGSGSSQTTAFDARTLAIRWTNDDFQAEGGLQRHGRTLVLTGGALVTIYPASGAVRDGVRIEHSSSSPTLAVGDALVDAGTDGLARLRL